MAPRRQEANSLVLASTATTETPPKSNSRTAWKSGDQLEYLTSHWARFVTYQSEKKLDRFWPRVYDGWYGKWPIIPSPQSINQYESRENAILTLRSENNAVRITNFSPRTPHPATHVPYQRIRTWFHNRGRVGSKSAKSDLRLTQNEKRKLAPAQAYCAYAWDTGLRDTVIARWEEQKQTYMSADEDDPTADSIEMPGSGSHIPIDFKLKIAKEVYNSLSAEDKKVVDDRREDERKKMYRTIPEITDAEERRNKLLMHKQ
jgi:hypothetical protein